MNRYARYVKEFRHKVRRDPLYDVQELLEIEQKQWGRRMRVVQALGEPVAGLGFAGTVVPNNAPVTNVTSTSSTTECCLLSGGTTTTIPAFGSSPSWMWIPGGNFRASQSWRFFAAGVYTTGSTTHAYTITTRIGTSTTITSNSTLAATGAVVPAATVTAGPWWYEGHMTVRTIGGVGALGTAVGVNEFDVGNAVAATNTVTGLGVTPTATPANLDTTIANAVCIDVATNTTGASIQLTQFMIVAWD